jgi:hypothetical protein
MTVTEKAGLTLMLTPLLAVLFLVGTDTPIDGGLQGAMLMFFGAGMFLFNLYWEERE